MVNLGDITLRLIAGRRTERERELLARSKEWLDTASFYPRPVSLRHVRIVVWPWYFKLPVLRRFIGCSCLPV
jgi:hypothetical protein